MVIPAIACVFVHLSMLAHTCFVHVLVYIYVVNIWAQVVMCDIHDMNIYRDINGHDMI